MPARPDVASTAYVRRPPPEAVRQHVMQNIDSSHDVD